MPSRNLQPSMYELRHPSRAQRWTLALFAALATTLAWWLLLAAGLPRTGLLFAASWPSGDLLRRACLAAAFSIYFVRLLFTEFVFLRRGVSWKEVFTVAPWLLFIVLFLTVEGGRNPARPAPAFWLGAFLFLLGSWMNSYAEFARHRWKLQPSHQGRLYTGTLFRWTRHPNYLGDLLSFSGLCLFTGRWITAIIPALMLTGFVFVNIPVLDAHLRDHYGAEFDDYARHTRKLIPYIY
ncbi:MAG: DUF1295 domain-containing protein [Acidobacteriaceae bacterium]